MARMGKFDMKGLLELQKELKKLQNPDMFVESCAKELAARLLRMVVKRTPTGEYDGTVEFDADIPAKHVSFDTKGGEHVEFDTKARMTHVKFAPKTGKKGGTLKRGWTSQASGSGSEGLKTNGASQYVDSLKVNHFGDTYVVEIVNPVEYASFVEFGHRTPNHKGWVEGKFMMTISEQELERIAPRVLENKIKKYLGECFK